MASDSTTSPSTSKTSHSSTHTSTHSTTHTPPPTKIPTHASPSPTSSPSNGHGDTSPGSALGFTLFALLVVLIIAVIGYISWRYWNARQRGLPPPQLNPFSDRNRTSSRGGIGGWVQDKISGFQRQRRAGGAYEGTGLGGIGGSSSRRRGFGAALDPDEAWDTRVGTEADVYGPGPYEEQELSGLRRDDGAYAGGGYSHARTASGYRSTGSLDEIEIGETGGRTTEFDQRYEEEMGRRGRPGAIGSDPFGDSAEPSNMSLRGVSPRPHEEEGGGTVGLHSNAGPGDSPTERRSMFREGV